MTAYNKRLDHNTELISIDYLSKRVKLLQPDSNPKFYYDEKLENINILEGTDVFLDGKEIFVGDKITDGKETYTVSKLPGGYYPFMMPINKSFRRI